MNTGNIARTCAATRSRLHLVKPLGFDISDRAVKRAGLDYWHMVDLRVYDGLEDLFRQNDIRQLWLATTHAPRPYTQARFQDGCWLFFGKETAGLPAAFRARFPERCCASPCGRCPQPQPGKRCRHLDLRSAPPAGLSPRWGGKETDAGGRPSAPRLKPPGWKDPAHKNEKKGLVLMNYDKKTIRDIDVSGKKILLRCDFNVPHDKKTGIIHDDTPHRVHPAHHPVPAGAQRRRDPSLPHGPAPRPVEAGDVPLLRPGPPGEAAGHPHPPDPGRAGAGHQGKVRRPPARPGRAGGEPPLPHRGGGERPGLRPGAGLPGGPLRL